MKFSREWAMPNGETFSVPPIGDFVKRWCSGASVIVDPFARNSTIGTHRNDINPDTSAQFHMEAEQFCLHLLSEGLRADAVLFDPPYSPRQIVECYQSAGLKAGITETQTGGVYRRVRNAFSGMVKPGGVVLSFGWNSVGMGKKHGYEIEEILIVCHGGAHNDTICVAERKLQGGLFDA